MNVHRRLRIKAKPLVERLGLSYDSLVECRLAVSLVAVSCGLPCRLLQHCSMGDCIDSSGCRSAASADGSSPHPDSLGQTDSYP